MAHDPARELFEAALDLDPSARAAFLGRACGSSPELRQRVEALLSDLEEAHEFLAAPTLADRRPDPAAATLPGAPPEGPGAVIGRYKLLEQIGEGGFGVVFMAEQTQPMVRRVALKIIKLGMDTRQVIARFEAERQALAMMDHPNIAKVLDAGATGAGRPYFVMELVKGVPITQYCDTNSLDTAERLALFIPVCHAVQHAHQKGIIHRDIKPSNVLITLHDGVPVPKVIDFGIAKATQGRLTDRTLFTEHRQMIGTPEYMSPEQAEMSGLDVDTRSDVYSLGVLLYELLTGSTPFEPRRLREAAYAEIQRIIREVEPDKPSTRLSTLGDTLPSIAARRGTEPRKLGALVKGDLDWIVMKALEKDRTRRYETANGLAADVQRHLSGEAVLAAPPSRAYRMHKFVRRNKGPVLAAALIGAALLAGLAGTAWQARLARGERDAAVVAQQHEAEQHQVADAQRAEAVRLKGVAEANAAAELKARNRAEYTVSFVIQALQSSNPQNGGRQDATILQAMDHAVQELHTPGALADSPETVAELKGVIAKILMNNGRPTEAEPLFTEALELMHRLHTGDHPDLAKAINNVAFIQNELGRPAQAEPLFEEALAMHRRLYTGDHPELATALTNLAGARYTLGRLAEAEPLFSEALAMHRRLHPGDHADVATALNNLAMARHSLGRSAEAESLSVEALEMRRRVFSGDHPDVESSLNNVAYIWQDLGRPAESEQLLREALAMAKRLFKGDHPSVASDLNNLASALKLSQPSEAEGLFLQALDMSRRLYPGDHPFTVMVLNNLARLLAASGRPAEAEPLYAEALAMTRRSFAGDRPQVASMLDGLSGCQEASGHIGEAASSRRDALAMYKRLSPPGSPALAGRLAQFGLWLLKRGTSETALEAEQVLRECLEIRSSAYPAGHTQGWLTFNSMSMLGEALLQQCKFADAEPLLLNAYNGMKDDHSMPSPQAAGGDRKQEALERVVRLYVGWDQAQPGKGYNLKAAEWKARLDAPLPAEPPPSPNDK